MSSHIFHSRWILGVSVVVLSLSFFVIGGATLAHASPPYAPGETLDPSCHPGDANCTVQIFANSGDLSGTSTHPIVVGLQGFPIATTTPTSSQVLQWNGTAWAPATIASGINYWSATSTGIFDNATGSVMINGTN